MLREREMVMTIRRLQLLTRVLPRFFSRSMSVTAPTAYSVSSLFSTSDDSSAGSSSELEDGEELGAAPEVRGTQVLRAYLRHRRSRCVGRVREQGLVPAVLVDSEKDRVSSSCSTDVFISLDAKPLVAILKHIGKRDFVSRVFDMEIYRSLSSSELQESLQVLPRNLNYGPGKTNILNAQFIRAPVGQNLKLGVPLEFLGTHLCPGLKKGGTLKMLAKYVLYKCKATEVPAKIVVDMSVLEIGDRVQVQDLEVDFDLLVSDRKMVVCEIVKDVRTLKAKARQLKNELLYKKKALARKEGCSQTCSLPDDVDVDNDGEDGVVPSRYHQQSALAKKGASRKMTSTKNVFAELDEDRSRHTTPQMDGVSAQSKISTAIESRNSRCPSKRRLTGTPSILSKENVDDHTKGNSSLRMMKRKALKNVDLDHDTLPSLTRKAQQPSKKGRHDQKNCHKEQLGAELNAEGGGVSSRHLGFTSSDSEADDEKALPSYSRRQTRTLQSKKQATRV